MAPREEAEVEVGAVLIVDDDEAICTVLRDALVADGFTVQTATSALAALTITPTPSLVILDLNLGGYPGELLVDRLARPGGQRVPIVAMSAEERARERLQGRAGVVAFLHKPMELDELLQICHALLPAEPPTQKAPLRQRTVG